MAGKIGLFAIGLEAYWAQFAGMRDEILRCHEILARKFSGCEVVALGLIDNKDKADAAGMRLRAEKVDAVFCHLSTYASSDALLPLVRHLTGTPVVLLNVQSVPALDVNALRGIGDWLGKGCTCAGLPEMTAALIRFEHPFDVVTGHLEGDAELDAEIDGWRLAASAKRRLQSGNIGILGRPFQGMMDLNVDETNLFRRFGTFVKNLNWEEVVKLMAAPRTEDELRAAEEKLAKAFALEKNLAREDLNGLLAAYAATEEFVSRHNLVALANHIETEPSAEMLKVIGMSNPVFSMLTQGGVPCPVEGDIKAAIAMLLLKTVAGSATLAELYSMNFPKDLCILGHSGAGDPDISDEKGELRFSKVFHGKPGSGFLTQFRPAAGPATMLAVTQDATGGYRMVVCEGEIVQGEPMRLGDTNCLFRFKRGLREFVNSWARRGPTHHSALGRGHHADNLAKTGLLLGIPVDTI